MSDVENFGHPEFDLLFVQLEVSLSGSLQSISEIFVMTFCCGLDLITLPNY